jgi:hypothetical protein
VGPVSAKPRLAGRARRVALDRFTGLRLNESLLNGARHGFGFLEAQTNEILCVSLDYCDVGGRGCPRCILNDQLDPHLHKDPLRPIECPATAEVDRLSRVE